MELVENNKRKRNESEEETKKSRNLKTKKNYIGIQQERKAAEIRSNRE